MKIKHIYIITHKFIENFSVSLDTVEWALLYSNNSSPNIRQMYICNTQYTANCVSVRVGEGNLIARCKHPSGHRIKHMV